MAHIEWVAGLCTALTFSCAVQIIITCFLAFAFSQFMPLLHCTLATGAGVVSGLVTVPTVVQLRASEVSSKVKRRYGYTIWFKRLAIGICALMQSITWLCTIINICTPYNKYIFLRAMNSYSKKQCSKSIVDNIQWFLQCCGSKSYKDWYTIDWGGFVFDTIKSRRKKTVSELLFDTDEFPEVIRTDTVPFSCCAEIAKSACIHQDLDQLGTYTINKEGCSYRLAATKQSILWTELMIYTVCLVLEITILILLKSDDGYENVSQEEQFVPKRFHGNEKIKFSKFLNQDST